MVGDAAKQLQLIQKSLTEMNLKLQHVFSDIDGVSAQAIINAILAGEREAKKLAALRDKRCRNSAEEIIEALCGDYREEYLFALGQSQGTYRQLREAIAACDEKLGELADRVECGLVIDDLSLCSAFAPLWSVAFPPNADRWRVARTRPLDHHPPAP